MKDRNSEYEYSLHFYWMGGKWAWKKRKVITVKIQWLKEKIRILYEKALKDPMEIIKNEHKEKGYRNLEKNEKNCTAERHWSLVVIEAY